MYLEIISPEAILYQGEVKSISFPGSYGDFQVLDNHGPIVSTLKKGKVKIQGKMSINKEVKKYFNVSDKETFLDINSGTVEMSNNNVTLLID